MLSRIGILALLGYDRRRAKGPGRPAFYRWLGLEDRTRCHHERHQNDRRQNGPHGELAPIGCHLLGQCLEPRERIGVGQLHVLEEVGVDVIVVLEGQSVGAESFEEFVFQGQEKLAAPRVPLSSGPARQLPVDASRIVALRPQDMGPG